MGTPASLKIPARFSGINDVYFVSFLPPTPLRALFQPLSYEAGYFQLLSAVVIAHPFSLSIPRGL